MANRLVSSVIIVDSAAGNSFIISTISNSASHFTKFHVNAIEFWSADTTGKCIISSGADTTNVIKMFGWVNGGAGFAPATQSTEFGQQQPLEDLKFPTLTAGTAWIYLA